MRKVRSERPQHVTVHGRDEIVVVAAEEFRRLKGSRSGQTLIDAIQSSPTRRLRSSLFALPYPSATSLPNLKEKFAALSIVSALRLIRRACTL